LQNYLNEEYFSFNIKRGLKMAKRKAKKKKAVKKKRRR